MFSLQTVVVAGPLMKAIAKGGPKEEESASQHLARNCSLKIQKTNFLTARLPFSFILNID